MLRSVGVCLTLSKAWLRDNFTQNTIIWSLCCNFPPAFSVARREIVVSKSFERVEKWQSGRLLFPRSPESWRSTLALRIYSRGSRSLRQSVNTKDVFHARWLLTKAASPMAACSLAALRRLIHHGAHWLVHALLGTPTARWPGDCSPVESVIGLTETSLERDQNPQASRTSSSLVLLF